MQSNDYWRRDSLDGGFTWGTPYQFKGEDGKDGADGYNGSDASVTRSNIVTAMLQAQTQDGLYTTPEGWLGLKATAITWSDNLGTLASTTGQHQDTGIITVLAHIQSSQGMLLSANNGGLRLQSSNGIYLTDDSYGSKIWVGKVGDWKRLSNLIGQSVAVFG